MTFKRVTSPQAGDATHYGGTDINKIADYIGGTDISATETVDIATPTKYSSHIDWGKISAPSDPSAEIGRVYFKTIDASNNGLFVKLKKGGVIVEVPIV